MEKLGRNEKCKCGSEKKYKKCCIQLDKKAQRISIYNRFMVIRDPRDNRGKRYYLMDLLIMVIYGIINGYTDFENMAYFLKQREKYFKNLLMIEKTPSADCLSYLFAMLDPVEFMEIFIEWVKEISPKNGTDNST